MEALTRELLRIFIAVDVEDPLLVSRLERLKDLIISTGVPMKPVETQNFHITLRFIGESPPDVVERVREALLSLKRSKFKIVFSGLGAFPSPIRPRVVWVGVTEGEEALKDIRDELERHLRAIGIRPERQSFHPHVTLARIKGSRNLPQLQRILNEYQDYLVGEMIVKYVRLKKSTLTRRGPIYETLAEVELE